MLPKQNRADTKSVEKIFKGGRVISNPLLSFRFMLIPQNPQIIANNSKDKYSLQQSLPPKISFIVPKTVAKLAVKRNKLRRIGYNALAKYIKDFPAGMIGALVYKLYEEDILKIENEIKNILNKIN